MKDISDIEIVEKFKIAKNKIIKEIEKVIIGQKGVIEQILVSLFSKGHCILVGVPGLAKTLIIKTIAEILDLEFKRIQFTPDLMPSDIIGTDVIEEDKIDGKRNFRFIKGPIFANIILADEINRTPPKTQSALLQAMQEYQVTAGGITYNLKLPFFVLATQNPIELEGTYPLPEAQLDRFMFCIYIDYPSRDEEDEIVKYTTSAYEASVEKIITGDEILKLQEIVRSVPISDKVIKYAVDLVRWTRPNSSLSFDFIKNWISWGAGPRASQYLVLGAKAKAILEGRYNASIDDIRAVAMPTLRHRIITNFNAEAEGVDSVEIIKRLLEKGG